MNLQFAHISLTRVGTGALALAATAVLVTACSSSGSGKGSTGSSTPAGGTSTTAGGGSTPTSGGSSTGGGGGTGVTNPFLSGFCKDYVAAAAKLGQAFTNSQGTDKSGLKAEITLFDEFTAKAPSSIKPAFQTLSKALHDIESGNYAALQGETSQLAAAEGQIGAYFSSGCH